MSFKTHFTSFLLWKTKGGVRLNVQAALFHMMKVKGGHGNQAIFSVNNDFILV